MTREKAIEILENGAWWDLLIPITTIEGRKSDIELHEALDIAIAALRNGWISVEDRLPEKPQYDWVLITGKFLEGGYMVPHIGEYRHGVWFVDCYDEPFEKFCMVKVTHWQPLPEPPAEDHNEN